MSSIGLRRAEPAPAASAPSDAEWGEFWRGHSVDSEIAMADFYGLRHVLLKFVPRHGRVLEAGCGLGRYVFYLRALGIRALGCDMLRPALATARAWAERGAPHVDPRYRDAGFFGGDVRQLPLRDGSLSGYISLGVIEHFPEGPGAALAEAYRLLQPGGIAIVEVPSTAAFDDYAHRLKRRAGRMIGRARRSAEAMHEEPIAPAALGHLLRRAGFSLLFSGGVDLIYPAWSLGIPASCYETLHRAEATGLSRWGGLAVAVGIKRGSEVACFSCGAASAPAADSAVAWCASCRAGLPAAVLAAYAPTAVGTVRWGRLDRGAPAAGSVCSRCHRAYAHDRDFGDWGFTEPVCGECVRQPSVNLEVAQRGLKRVWRPRSVG